jgi:hypothetical protein
MSSPPASREFMVGRVGLESNNLTFWHIRLDALYLFLYFFQ